MQQLPQKPDLARNRETPVSRIAVERRKNSSHSVVWTRAGGRADQHLDLASTRNGQGFAFEHSEQRGSHGAVQYRESAGER